MTNKNHHISDLVAPFLEVLWQTRAVQLLGACWNCGRSKCPEPDGFSCRAYVLEHAIPDEEIPF